MGWIAWAALGYLLNAVAIAVDKALLARRSMNNPAVYTVFISTLGLLVFVLAPWGLERPSTLALTYGLLSGACFTLGLWSMFTVLKYGEASRVPAFIGGLNPLFVFLGSWWLMGEHLSGLEVVAFALLVLGGFTMVGGRGGLKGRGLVIAVASAAVFGLAYVLIKLTFGETNFISGLIWTRVGGFVASLFLFLVSGTWTAYRYSLTRSGSGMKFAFIGGQAAGAVGGLMNSYAITLGSVTLVNALQGIQYVFLLGLAAVVSFRYPLFFKDEFSGQVAVRKLLATLLIVVGLWFLSLA